MKTIKVLWLSYYPEVPNTGYWDMTMLHDLFTDNMWLGVDSPNFEFHYYLNEVEPGEGAIVIIPSRYHYKDVDRINNDLARFPWVILMIIGDEESIFPTEKIRHPNMKLWVMTPVPGRHKADHFLIHGYTPDTRPMCLKYTSEHIRNYDWFFSGQGNHRRRQECFAKLSGRKNGILNETTGFSHGMSHFEYFDFMARSKVIPCPSGPATPDSFRCAEALEAGCVPIADDCAPDPNYPPGYWTNVFGETPPFWIIRDWDSFPGYMEDILSTWPACANKVFAWWQNYKRKMVYDVLDDIRSLCGLDPGKLTNDLITVLIPTSPIPSHPDTKIIEETIKSIRFWLPASEIMIMVDGIRENQKHYTDQYNEYVRRLLWKCNYEWRNILPIVFPTHHHQARMTRETLKKVRTPLIMFVEHDTPLIIDRAIDWTNLEEVILMGNADLIRFHYDNCIYESHQPLMLDKEPKNYCGIPLIRTIQWSQRPHLASTSFYRRILQDKFSPDALTMIEDRMHSVVQQNYAENPQMGWFDYRLTIYVPDGLMQRSYHLDGRQTDSKFETDFTY